jgi:hypothetical protein
MVWEKRDDRCQPTDWAGPTKSELGWDDAEAGQKRFGVQPTHFVEQLRRPGAYLVTGRLARTSVEQPNPQTEWLRDWSFVTADRAIKSDDGPQLHRTLNLAEFSRLLENALADAAERNPGPITGFTFAVQIDD